ncbi:putative cytochrome P450 [Nemania diffusa]|nr:putative cytochrome P450 [Nemania diffusa]
MSLSLVLLGLIWAISVGSLIVVVWTLSEWALAMWEDDTKTRRFAALSSPLLVLQFLKSRWRAMAFVFQGPAIIQAAYEQSNGAPFFVETPSNTIVLVSDWDRIKEINAAPEGTLSLLAAAKDLLQPKNTMSGFDWNVTRGSDGAPLQMTLRSRLVGYLPVLLPDIRRDLAAFIDQRIGSLPTMKSGEAQGPIFPIILEAVARSNARAFFGSELSQNQEFLIASIKTIEQTLIMAEILRVVPTFLLPYVGQFLSNRLNASKIMNAALTDLVAQRFQDRDLRNRGHNTPKYDDCIQWIMDHCPKHRPWGVTRIVHELIAVWFGSVHIASTTACAAVFDLCDHPDLVDILRQEIEHTGWAKFDESSGQILPLMDSFMKESARLNPIESVSTRRKVLKPFHFSDGTTVQPGDWICSAPGAMNRNPAVWSEPDEFYPFRFVSQEAFQDAKTYLKDQSCTSALPLSSDQFKIPEAGKATPYTDISDWQQWGTGKGSCTGRWYASAALKVIIGLLIMEYDFTLVDPAAERYFSWRTFKYPYASTHVAIRPRENVWMKGHRESCNHSL